MNRECTLLILAGGKGVRMEMLGHLSSKASLVTYNQPLLVRILEQAREAGLHKVLISTSPSLHESLKNLLSAYSNYSLKSLDQVSLISNEAHEKGPIEALQQALCYIKTDRCIICLGDMFFIRNPFGEITQKIDESSNYLGVASVVFQEELRCGGLVCDKDGLITEIIEKPIDTVKNAFRWTGIALVNSCIFEDIRNIEARTLHNYAVGDLFECHRNQGYSYRSVLTSDFVNINSPRHLFLASCYAVIEEHRHNIELCSGLATIALQLRVNVLKSQIDFQATFRS